MSIEGTMKIQSDNMDERTNRRVKTPTKDTKQKYNFFLTFSL